MASSHHSLYALGDTRATMGGTKEVQQYSLHSQAMEVGKLSFSWKIKNVSNLKGKMINSDVFSLGPYKWMLNAVVKEYEGNEYLFLYLRVADPEILSSGWSRKAKYSFTLVNQMPLISFIPKSAGKEYEFKERNSYSYSTFPLKELHGSYLVKDTIIIKADVTMYGDDYLDSHIPSKETNKEDDLAKNATEEDIIAFFGDLNSVIFPKKVVSLEEDAKEALTIIEEVLSMVPADVNHPGRIAQLTNAFDILSSLDDCSIFTLDQKENFLSMKDTFIALPERAANAGKKKKLFAEKELVKKTLDNKLGRYLSEFEKIKSETKQNEQNIATLQERVDSLLTQIGDTKKKRESLVLKQKEMFKVSMKLKAELDVLVKESPEYEAEMKSAEEEEKIVSIEWDKMKKLVSSLKTPST